MEKGAVSVLEAVVVVFVVFAILVLLGAIHV